MQSKDKFNYLMETWGKSLIEKAKCDVIITRIKSLGTFGLKDLLKAKEPQGWKPVSGLQQFHYGQKCDYSGGQRPARRSVKKNNSCGG